MCLNAVTPKVPCLCAFDIAALPKTVGFSFGDSDGTEIEDDLKFVAEARVEIAKGNAVVYDSGW